MYVCMYVCMHACIYDCMYYIGFLLLFVVVVVVVCMFYVCERFNQKSVNPILLLMFVDRIMNATA